MINKRFSEITVTELKCRF